MDNQFEEPDQPMQSVDEIMQIIQEATIPAANANSLNQYLTGSLDIDDDMEEDLDSDPELDIDSSGEVIYAMWLIQIGMVNQCFILGAVGEKGQEENIIFLQVGDCIGKELSASKNSSILLVLPLEVKCFCFSLCITSCLQPHWNGIYVLFL